MDAMKLLSVRALRGPNLWSDATAIQADVSIDPNEVDILLQRAVAVCPGLVVPPSGSPTLRAVQGLGDLARQLQVEAGSQVELIRVVALAAKTDARLVLVLGYQEEAVARRAIEVAHSMMIASDQSLTWDAAVRDLRNLIQAERLGPSTGSIVAAARARGIYARRVTDGSLVQLGQGARQRRIWAAETDRTSAIGEAIAQNKALTKQLLEKVGVPVPKGKVPHSADEAWEVARAIGGPVVVKPLKGNQGKRVSVGLKTREEVVNAFELARLEGRSEVVVERQIFGDDYRLLVVGGRLVAAARREVPRVTGDGVATIRQLVAVENEDPRRGDDHSTSLSKMVLDDIASEVLAGQGLDFDSIPAAGQTVVLRRNANLSTGGTAVDVTDIVHPDVAARAIEAARMVGLDIAGIDLVATRVDRPLAETGGAFVEVNAAPGLRMHLDPSEGQGRAVGEAIVESMFRPGETARIPVVAVTGTNGKTTTVRCIAHIIKGLGHTVGVTCTDGIYVDGRRIDTGDCSGPKSARAVLAHPLVDAAVLETARGGILREGLGFDQCDVAVVTNIAEGDHLGMAGIDTAEQLADVKATIVRAVAPSGAAVLNAADPLCVGMAPRCPGGIVYFARQFDHPVLVAHRRAGGRFASVRDGWFVVGQAERVERLIPVDAVPLTHGGRVGFEVDNVLASAAACWSVGVPKEIIGSRLGSFRGDVGTVPGRFNVITHGRSTIILDYGHNASALVALVEAISALPHQSRSIVYTPAGDRRDIDIFEQAAIIGNEFDRVYIYEDKCMRGRADGEVIRLMRQGLGATRRVRQVIEARGEFNAIQMALDALRPGDLLLCQVDQVEEALEFVQRSLASRPRRMPSVSELPLGASPMARAG
jgi:cyanophycin synthetase